MRLNIVLHDQMDWTPENNLNCWEPNDGKKLKENESKSCDKSVMYHGDIDATVYHGRTLCNNHAPNTWKVAGTRNKTRKVET